MQRALARAALKDVPSAYPDLEAEIARWLATR